MLASGFTIVRDMGNNGHYADTALRQAIEQGWIPGPTIIHPASSSARWAASSSPTPEMSKDHNIVYPEYLDANTPRRDRQGGPPEPAVRREGDQDLRRLQAVGLLGRRHQAVHRRGGEGGAKVDGHVQTPDGAQRAIDAGIHVISHGQQLTPAEEVSRVRTHLPSGTGARGGETSGGVSHQSRGMDYGRG